MSWLLELYKTFDANKVLLEMGENPLIPICHTTQQAHVEVVLNGKGEFLRASVVPKENNETLIPVTEDSSTRSGSKPIHHPLCDKLQYVAGDFVEYGGKVTSGYSKDPAGPHINYLLDLRKWASSSFTHPKIIAILDYIEKGKLIADLIDYEILQVDESNSLIEKWTKDGKAPAIFEVLANSQASYDAFVRWIVEIPGEIETKVWKDHSLYESWINYYAESVKDYDICYVTGEKGAIAKFHPAKIRNSGDMAKLISANDNSGFTFKGRFLSSNDAVNVGLEVTQKAHNMLRWLIKNQGFQSGDLAIVSWAKSTERIPNPVHDSISFLRGKEEPDVAYTAEEFALKLRKKILGFKKNLGEFTNINVIALDSATPGRMSINFYKNLLSSEFFQKLEHWHNVYAWEHSYRPYGIKDMIEKRYVGTPSLYDIAEAAYGSRVDTKLRSKTIERLLPCVISGQAFPRDVLTMAVKRAANRVGFKESWEWEKTLTVACSLFRGANEKEGYTLTLEKDRATRDYLYGRLLAYADQIEKWALSESEAGRPTNASRLMNRFAERPYSTWRNLELSLKPYIDRLGKKSTGMQRGLSEVMCAFERDDFVNDRPLSGEFLLGYHCQIRAFWNDRDVKKDDDNKPNPSEESEE